MEGTTFVISSLHQGGYSLLFGGELVLEHAEQLAKVLHAFWWVTGNVLNRLTPNGGFQAIRSHAIVSGGMSRTSLPAEASRPT